MTVRLLVNTSLAAKTVNIPPIISTVNIRVGPLTRPGLAQWARQDALKAPHLKLTFKPIENIGHQTPRITQLNKKQQLTFDRNIQVIIF